METKWRKALQIFRNEQGISHGDIFTPTQVQIVDIIAKRRFPRVQLILPTQYGKSYCVADGVLLRASIHKEKWAIVAPSEEKARIIMDYIIDGIFSDDMFMDKLDYNGTKETLKKERSKTRITFRGAGEIRVYSGNASNTRATKSALMGFGSANIILDEAGQISDELYSTVKRMVGGSEGTEQGTFLLEIGNPVFRNHFHRTWFGERYMKIYLNDEMALAEGRYTRDFLDEMKDEAGYEWMYGCIFPDANEVLPDGYRRLISDTVTSTAMVEVLPDFVYLTDDHGNRIKNKWGFDEIDDKPILGIDVAGTGANATVGVLRFPKHNVAMKVFSTVSDDVGVQADLAEEQIKKWTVTDYRVAVDAGGVGHGLGQELVRRNYLTWKVLFGATHQGDNKDIKIGGGFANIKAWLFWEMRKWLTNEKGLLLQDSGFLEINLINYKENSSMKIQIEPKEKMIERKSKEGKKVESPDTADAFALTFISTSTIVDESDFDFDDDV